MVLFDNVTITVSVRSNDIGRIKLKFVPDQDIDVEHVGRTVKFGYGRVVPSMKGNSKPGKSILILFLSCYF